MSRRVPFAPTVFWLIAVLALVSLAFAVSVAPSVASAGESEDVNVIQVYRPTIDNPEVGIPGDDDQPTVTPRRRGNTISITNPQSSAAGNAVGAPMPRTESGLSRYLEAVRK